MIGIGIRGVGQRASGASSVGVSTPNGFRWSHGLTFSRTASELSSTFSVSSFTASTIPVTKTYYVDPVGGSDAAAGTSGAPLLTLSVALGKADVDEVVILLPTTDFFARTTKSWNNLQVARNISVRVQGDGRFVSINCGSSTMPTWTQDGTFPVVYRTTISSGAASAVTDLSARTAHPSLDGVATTKHAQVLAAAPRPFTQLVKVASLAAVNALPGSWFHDGTDLCVQAHDSRSLVADVLMQPTANTNNGRFAATTGRLLALQGIDFVGGRPWYSTATEAANVTGTKLILNNCTFQGSGFANGVNIEMFQEVYVYRCGAYNNWNDGFNYHCPSGPTVGGYGVSPSVFENECVSYGNGQTGSAGGSDNASTSHEYAAVIRLNCVYPRSDDRVVADTDYAHGWLMGCYVGQAIKTTAGNESIAALINALVWLDTVTAVSGSNPRWISVGTAILYHYNSGTVVNAGTGEATGAVRAYTGAIDTEVVDWVDRAVALGGTISAAAQAAATIYVASLKAAGLLTLIRRNNLGVGNDLTTSLVPFINTSGGATDTNVNLVSGDYSESLGWQTDGSTKYIDTGYTPSEATGGIAMYLRTTQTSIATGSQLMGASGAAAAQCFALRANRDANNTTVAGAVSGLWGGANVLTHAAGTGGMVAGMWHVARTSGTAEALYLNGSSVGSTATPCVPATAGVPLFVFCLNNNGSPAAFAQANTRIAGYAVSTGMNATQAAAFYTIMQTFQTSMSRQV